VEKNVSIRIRSKTLAIRPKLGKSGSNTLKSFKIELFSEFFTLLQELSTLT
jgi:hypothetical protein